MVKKLFLCAFLLFSAGLWADNSPALPCEGYAALDYIDYAFSPVDPFVANPHFIPLGWSREGKIAYILERNFDGVGAGPLFEWVVQDMVTDVVLWSSGIDLEAWMREWGELAGHLDYTEMLESDYTRNIECYRPVLDRYGIVLQSDWEGIVFPYQWEGSSFLPRIEKTPGEFWGMPGYIESYTVWMEKNQIQKSITTVEQPGLLEVQVAGALMSPFESRMAVVLCETRRGWEGPPHPVTFRLSGCLLSGGFSSR